MFRNRKSPGDTDKPNKPKTWKPQHTVGAIENKKTIVSYKIP